MDTQVWVAAVGLGSRVLGSWLECICSMQDTSQELKT